MARGGADLEAAQRLRYDVFVEELGAAGACVDSDRRLETDRWDAFADHLILREGRRDEVVGVYRLLTSEAAEAAGGYYSAGEYDLAPLVASGRRLLELGRTCLHPDHRGGTALSHLWAALVQYCESRGIEILFGSASFHGTDIGALAAPMSLLHHRHLAPPDIRVRALPGSCQRMDLLDPDSIDRAAAIRQVPALIKAYLRLGGFVGDGAFVDHAFNTTDVCLILDTARLNERQVALYRNATP
ncbi:GNAT family N-acyltransferase [Sulfitobacter sp. LCG007]